MDWNKTKIDGITANEYLKKHYEQQSDSTIAEKLSKVTQEVITKNAVRKARMRLTLYKSNTQVDTNNEATISNTLEFVNQNQMEVTAKTSHLETLIDTFEIDTDIWEVQNFKTWQNFAKVDGEITTVNLMSASFYRKQPFATIPTIHPINCQVSYNVPEIKKSTYITELIASDTHFGFRREKMYSDKLLPFHNEKSIGIFSAMAKRLQPEYIRILGDIFDFADFSDKFLHSPEFAYLTQPAINAAYNFLHNLRVNCPNTQIIVNFGNHDLRLENMLIRHLPFVYGLKAANELELPPQLSIPRLLALDSLGILYTNSYPNDYNLSANGLLEYGHGLTAKGKSGSTVSSLVSDADISKVIGHIHRVESCYKTIWRGNKQRVISAHSFGCLCETNGVVPGYTARQNWQNGFGKVIHTANDFQVFPYRITDNHCLTEYGIII